MGVLVGCLMILAMMPVAWQMGRRGVPDRVALPLIILYSVAVGLVAGLWR